MDGAPLHGTARGERVVAGIRLSETLHAPGQLVSPAGAGFTDQAHLTRVFRRVTGTTPGRYRALFRA